MNKLQKIVKRIDWHQRKWFASWHTWAGIIAGSVLIITGITGTILVFENEIDIAMNPNLFNYKKQEVRISFEEATKQAKEQYPNLNYLGVYRMSELNDIYMFNALKSNDKNLKQVFVNPYNGKVSKIRTYKNTFIGFIREIHTSLLIPKVGKYLVGISSLTCLILIITGLRLWIPKSLRQVKGRLKIGFKNSSKRVNYDLHRVLGFYFSPIITMLSLSGIMITFAQFCIIFLFLLNFESPSKLKDIFGQKSICNKNCQQLKISTIDSLAKVNFPEAKLTGITFPINNTASYNVMMLKKSVSKTGKIILAYFNQYSGKLQAHSNKEEFRLVSMYFNWIKGIHLGTFGGWATRIMVLLGSLVITILFISGIIIWIPRWKRGDNHIKKLEKNKIKI